MPLSFDPDFQPGTSASTFAAVITTTDIPAGSAGDVLVFWIVTDLNVSNEVPEVTEIRQNDSVGDQQGTLTVVSSVTQSNDAATIITAVGTRIADLGNITTLFDPYAGAAGFILANFPAGTYDILTETNWPYEEHLVETVTAPGTGIFAGMVVAENWTDPTTATANGAGSFESETVSSPDYDLVAWAYETATADASFEVTGDWLTYTLVLGAPAGRWRTGRVGWPR